MYMGTIDSEDDFNGYYNCMAILEYLKGMNCCLCPPLEVAINYGKKSIGWRWRDDGLVGYTENPMIRTDETDKYEWQLSLAAPQSSSGWFLPSYGQIAYADIGYHLNRPDVWDFMVGQFDKVKNATTREGLKWKIREARLRFVPKRAFRNAIIQQITFENAGVLADGIDYASLAAYRKTN